MSEPSTSAVVAFLSIKTQFDNLGDALINRELCRLVADRAETYVDFSRAPQAFRRSMQVEGYRNLSILQRWGFVRLLLKMLSMRLSGRRCYFFLNPGGLGGKRKPLKSLASALAYNVVLGLLAACGVRICQTGISYDAMGAPERFVASWRRRLLYSFTVRDHLSAAYLNSIGMSVDEIVPDLSFSLYRQDVSVTDTRPAIAFSFRFDGKSHDQQIERAVRRVMKHQGPGYDYLFVIQVARDKAGMIRLQKACAGEGRTRLVFCCHDIDELSQCYAGCAGIYSNRLHALLLAAHAGTSPYGLVSRGRQPKIESLFNDLGMADRLYFIDEPHVDLSPIPSFDYHRFSIENQILQSYFNKLLGPRSC